MHVAQVLLTLPNHLEDDPILLPLALDESQPACLLRHEFAFPFQEVAPVGQLLTRCDRDGRQLMRQLAREGVVDSLDAWQLGVVLVDDDREAALIRVPRRICDFEQVLNHEHRACHSSWPKTSRGQ